MTLIASYGGPDSNAYINVTQANSFILSTLIGVQRTTWQGLNTREREACLMQASRDIDSRQYVGSRRFSDQLLEFPRQLRSAFPFNRTSTETITQDTEQRRMQTDVQRACAYQAAWLAEFEGLSNDQANQALGIKQFSERVGPISQTVIYGQRGGSGNARLSPQALSHLQPWLISGRRIFRG